MIFDQRELKPLVKKCSRNLEILKNQKYFLVEYTRIYEFTKQVIQFKHFLKMSHQEGIFLHHCP